ncbi:MAG: hypothetical protein BWY59_01805 [Verrucomicrobia bacterium ADurb.Bin345]|nr:MAG: hypothetical protein BWY59_01805 [Verrucomicrobia bacterium ADurb.Bin345]
MSPAAVSEQDIIGWLERAGPLRGAQLLDMAKTEALPLWRTCRQSSRLHTEIVGRRYLRLDRAVEGYARLSPSIRREFLTYTILGVHAQAAQVADAARKLQVDIERISAAKCALAESAMRECVEEMPDGRAVFEHACFIIAGDVTYGMGHDVPRPERSTGQMVRGSDLDVIVVVSDEMPATLVERLDDAILKKKHYFLVHPDLREEVDYIIKPLARVREQLLFDTFEHMVACKILDEGRFLLGSSSVFKTVKRLVAEHGVSERIAEMNASAASNREQAERALLGLPESESAGSFVDLFYTREEGDEIY